MSKQRIMYVCEVCEEHAPESCGHFDRSELAVAHDGAWLCEGCWDEYDHQLPGNETAKHPTHRSGRPFFNTASRPPEYAPII
jgi:hypothetical protein